MASLKSLKRLFFVIPAPYQARGKLQQESSLFKHLEFSWIPVFTGMTTFCEFIIIDDLVKSRRVSFAKIGPPRPLKPK
jgi:hypothetical protein